MTEVTTGLPTPDMLRGTPPDKPLVRALSSLKPSDSPVYGALVAAQLAVKPLQKDAFNKFHGYRYASSEAVIDEGRKALNQGGLALFCIGWGLTDDPEIERVQKGKNRERVLVVKWVWGDYVLAHESGAVSEPMRYKVAAILEPGRPDDKAIAGALTLQLAYVLRQLLLIPRLDQTADVHGRDDRNYQPTEHRNRVKNGLAALSELGLSETRLLAHLGLKDAGKIKASHLATMRKLYQRLEDGESVADVLGRANGRDAASPAEKGSPNAQGGKDAPEDPPPSDEPHDQDDWEAEAARDLA